jgi:GT2 family glycosyltransferase
VEQPAAIAIFVYKRAAHTRRMLRSLLQNQPLARSSISIYCDGPRGDHDAQAVREARAAVRELAPAHARIVERERNLGLAGSVIAGVSETVAAHGAAIVLEDDLELSPVALDYFNAALARYRDEDRVMHVAGYMYPVRAQLPEAFFYREATCYGWATWARAWRHFEPDAGKIREAVLERGAPREFNAGALDFFGMLEQQIAGKIDSWGVRWYGSLWLRGGLALHPGRTLVRNTGFDGSGVHTGPADAWEDAEPSIVPVTRFPDRIAEEPAAARAVTAWRKRLDRRRGLASMLRAWRGRISRLAG